MSRLVTLALHRPLTSQFCIHGSGGISENKFGAVSRFVLSNFRTEGLRVGSVLNGYLWRIINFTQTYASTNPPHLSIFAPSLRQHWQDTSAYAVSVTTVTEAGVNFFFCFAPSPQPLSVYQSTDITTAEHSDSKSVTAGKNNDRKE